jgi:acyl-CoA dehydrogenase
VINGRKWFTSSADGAKFAIVMAITDPDAEPHRRASMLIVPTDTPGFRLVRNIPIFGHAGADYDSHAEIAYEDCRVPAENLLGPGARRLRDRPGAPRPRAHPPLHALARHLRARPGAPVPPRRRPPDRPRRGPRPTSRSCRSWIAESRARIDAARLTVLRTAWLIDQQGFAAAREDVSLIKFHVADVLSEVLERAIQVHGALGLTDDTVLAYFYTRERGAHIYDGPDEVHKVSLAKRVLKRYGITPA